MKASSFHLLRSQHLILPILTLWVPYTPKRAPVTYYPPWPLPSLLWPHLGAYLHSLCPGRSPCVHTKTFGVTSTRWNIKFLSLLILVNNASNEREAWKSPAQKITIQLSVFTLNFFSSCGFLGYSCWGHSKPADAQLALRGPRLWAAFQVGTVASLPSVGTKACPCGPWPWRICWLLLMLVFPLVDQSLVCLITWMTQRLPSLSYGGKMNVWPPSFPRKL